jgi:hypothetical protein
MKNFNILYINSDKKKEKDDQNTFFPQIFSQNLL